MLCLIFDLDGTLVDSEAGLQAAEYAGMRAVYFNPCEARPSGVVYACVKNLLELPGVFQSAAHAARL
jgi:beta-phosphoglucomutase-like phosphatase (HAD superfamily)